MSSSIASVQEFRNFLESLNGLNIVNENTARNLKNSSARLLTVVNEEEMSDVSKLDVNILAERYIDVTVPKPSDSSITAYKSRTDSAIKKFLAYRAGEEIPYRSLSKDEVEEEDLIGKIAEQPKKALSKHTFTMPVLLRPETGLTVTIEGIPTDLTNEEAERIASILKVYVRPQ